MSMASSFVAVAASELGYLEKSRANWEKYGINCLYDKTRYAGADNVQKYAFDTGHYKKYGWAAWCMSFVVWVMMAKFGKEKANTLLCGMFDSASTMDTKNAMIKAGCGVDLSKAQAGDIVFRSRNGGGHVGIVKGWQNGKIVTIEGNSSSSDLTSWNGGAVVEHVGASWNWCCRPDWSLIAEPEAWRWVNDGQYWYYQDQTGKNSYGWQLIKETNGDACHWYYFNSKGQMLTGIQQIDGEWCFFQPNGEHEGAMCCTDKKGYLQVWDL